jgi:hypothetical protein
MATTVTQDVYDVHIKSISDESKLTIKESVQNSLNDFYEHYIVETVDGSFQVFQSFTYGEMAISLLLVCILSVMSLKWFWEVLR